MPKIKVRATYKGGKNIELEKELGLPAGEELEMDIYRIYEGKYPLIEGRVAVYLARTEIEAGFVIEALLEEGIEAEMYSQRDHWIVTTIAGFSIVRVIVDPMDVKRAEEVLLKMHEDGRFGAAEDVSIIEEENEEDED